MTMSRARLALAAFLLLVGAARADDSILHACMIDQEPWGSLSAPRDSIYGEVFAAIGKVTGMPVDYVVGPLARTLDNVRTGVCQFTITSWQPARAEKMTLGATLASLEYGILPRIGFTPMRESDLRGHSIAVARGLLLGNGFDDDAAIGKVGVYGYDQAILMTAGGRAEGAAGSIVTLRWFARRHAASDKFGAPLVLSRERLAVQKNNAFAETALARAVDDVVTRLRESGEVEDIVARHFDR